MTVTFTGLGSVADRTIYTRKGPIVKRPLELLTGSNLTVISETEVSVPTAPFAQSHVGKQIRIVGSPGGRNDGTFTISRVRSATRAVLEGSTLSVVDADATVQAMVLAANALRAKINAHMVQTGVHFAVDTFHPITAPAAYNLDSTVALTNDIRAQFAAHVVFVGSGPVHALADEGSVPALPAAHDFYSCLQLLNQLLRLFRAHRDNVEVHHSRDAVNSMATAQVDIVRGSGPNVGPFAWTLLDPRIGEIADDPMDVSVTVNGVGAEVEAVFGLLGAVVLKNKPSVGASVSVDYDYLTDPSTQIRRLNSPEFNLNQVGNRGFAGMPGHKYRARAYLPRPTAIQSIVHAPVTPKKVGWKYKAFQRAYSAVLNDPNALLLNVPTNRIANPVLDKEVSETTLRYDPTSLPQFSYDPWTLQGRGTFTLAPGGTELTISDTSTHSGADSEPPFFAHAVDLSFPSAVYAAFRMSSDAAAADGVFTGTAFGVVDGPKAAVVGLLLTAATNLSSAIVLANDIRQKYSAHLTLTGTHIPNDATSVVGLNPSRDLASLLVLLAHLKSVFNRHLSTVPVHQVADATNTLTTADPKTLSEAISFVNELQAKFDAHRTALGVHYHDDAQNKVSRVRQVGLLTSPTLQDQSSWDCEAVDWSQMTTYRLHRDVAGTVRLYVGGDVVPVANVPPSGLPAASDLDIRFDTLHQVFFGEIGKSTVNTSHWAFLRANVMPAQAHQIGGNKSVVYAPPFLPELDTIFPWITVGQSGMERIVSNKLLLDSTASAHVEDVKALGLATGAYRGFVRYEPSLSRTATSSFEFQGSVAYSTASVDNKSTGVFLDDGTLSVHLAYIEASPSPATTTSTQDEPFPISSGDTLIIATGTAAPITVTFGTALSTASSIAAAINAVPGMPVASVDTGRLVLKDSVSGAASKFQVIGGTAVDKLGIRVGTYYGRDSNVGPRISWFGAYLPDEEKVAWIPDGSQDAELRSRTLRIHDTDASDYRVYTFSDALYTKTVVAGDWKLDFRAAVVSHTPSDPIMAGSNLRFCGVLCSVDEGPSGKNVEVHFSRDSLGTPYLNVMSYSSISGQLNTVAEYPFAWNDGKAHTINVFATKSSDLCLVLADGTALGTFAYSGLQAGTTGPAITFGSGGQPVGNGDLRGAQSVVDWNSVALFVSPNPDSVAASRRYIGLYRGGDPTVLSSYYLHQVDWSAEHTYRIVRDPQGAVNVYVDAGPTPVISANYDAMSLPPSDVSFLADVTGSRGVVAFGSFSPFELSRSSWTNVKYSIGEISLTDRLVVGHQVNNQAHVVSSPEHLRTRIPHSHANTRVYSGGTPSDDFLSQANLVAETMLGEGTPPVPMTQDLASRGGLFKVVTPTSAVDSADFVNTRGFLTDLEDDGANTLSVVPSTTLSSCISVINELRTAFNHHLSQYRVHATNDVDNLVTAPLASSLPTAIALANSIRSAFQAHLVHMVGYARVHTTDDIVNTLVSPEATDLPSLAALCAEMSNNYSSHLTQSGVHASSVFIRLDAPQRVLYDRMKFFKTEEGGSGLLSSFTDDYSGEMVDFSSFAALLRELQSDYNAHLIEAGVHSANDTANAVVQILPTLVVNPDGTANFVLADAIAATNELKAKFNLHLVEAGVHVVDDVVDTVTAADASDLPSAILLVNDIRSKYATHIADATYHVAADAVNTVSSPAASEVNIVILY